MTREFTDLEGNDIVDIEYRLTPAAVIRALLDNGTLTADDVAAASGGRIRDVTEERGIARALAELKEQAEQAEQGERTRRIEEAQRKAEAEALKNRAVQVVVDPAADFEATRNKAPE